MTWKFACSAGETSTWMEAARYFGDLISEATGGAVTVDYYPSDQLTSGSQTDGIQACMDGTTELSMHSNLIYSSFDDRFSVVSLPFLFDSTDAADAVLDGEGGDALQEVLGEYGLHCMGLAENGFRHVTNSKHEIKTPVDMEGLVIRVAGSSVLMEAYGAWGANYTKANWSEVYTGLQTGTYDGQENPVPTMDSASIQEVQKYVTYWTGAYDCLFFVMNAELYNSLSPELQAIVDDCGQQACEYQREINRAGDEEILARWESENGMTVHYLTADEMVAFKTLSDPVYDIYAQMLLDDGYDADFVTNYLASFGVTVELG
jgi:C4-dicarboxylate transporter DctM subunit